MNRRETKQREAILKLLKNTHTHPTADQIYDEVRKEIPNISKGTVYRNLGVLIEDCSVKELKLNGTSSRFDARLNNHYHFRCEQCGRVFDLDEPVNTEIDKKISLRTGFKVAHHQMEFHGLCKDCQK